jgi:rhamnosyl/mannosyltransferase
MKQEVEGHGAAHRVRLLGPLADEDVVAHLHACDVFTLPSVTNAETFGVAQLEAMACGKPVISTALRTGVPWVNRHEETGLIVPPGDPAALAQALNSLLTAPALRDKLGQAGVRRVQAEFTLHAMNTRAAALYRAVMLERAPGVAPAPPTEHAAISKS